MSRFNRATKGCDLPASGENQSERRRVSRSFERLRARKRFWLVTILELACGNLSRVQGASNFNVETLQETGRKKGEKFFRDFLIFVPFFTYLFTLVRVVVYFNIKQAY